MIILSMKAAALLGGLAMLSVPLSSRVYDPLGKPKPVTVSGCLQLGDEKGDFVLTTKTGAKYEVGSKTVDLGPHVGHTVKVKGTLVAKESGESAKEEKAESKATEQKEEKMEKAEMEEHELGHIWATSVSMINQQCQVVLH